MWVILQAAIPAHLRASGFGVIRFVKTVGLGLTNILAGIFLVDWIGTADTVLCVCPTLLVLSLLPTVFLINNLDLRGANQDQKWSNSRQL